MKSTLIAVIVATVIAACCPTAEAGRGWRISIGLGGSGYSYSGGTYGALDPRPYHGAPAGYYGSPAGFYGRSGYGPGGFDSGYWYPKYYGGFHARYFQDIGYPSGDTNGFRGTPR